MAAHIDEITIHYCKKINVKEQEYEGTRWLDIDLDGFKVGVFGMTKEDLRAALYRSDMEEYDHADSA